MTSTLNSSNNPLAASLPPRLKANKESIINEEAKPWVTRYFTAHMAAVNSGALQNKSPKNIIKFNSSINQKLRNLPIDIKRYRFAL